MTKYGRKHDVMKYDTIIFDLDGTLLNTLEDLHDSLNAVLFQEGYKIRTLKEVRCFVGNGIRKLIARSLPDNCDDNEINRITEIFQLHYKNNMLNKTRPYDGIINLLTYLKENDFKTAIVSNKFDSAVKTLAKIYFDGMITVAIGETDKIRRKPAPDSIFSAVNQLASSLDKTIMVGDSETDVLTAKNAGIACVGVTWGFRDRLVLENHGADYIIDTPSELMEIVS